jgi:4-alpha-glucanotransferase
MARKDRPKIPTLSTRSSGILLHPTSLPSEFGSGDLGPKAFQFADSLAKAGMRWWQMLPTARPGPEPEFSPYSSHSAFAGSPWLISPELLFQDGLLSRRDLDGARIPVKGRIDFARMEKVRAKLLKTAFANAGRWMGRQAKFVQKNSAWLDDYSLYAAIRESRGEPWIRWPAELRLREPAALAAARETLAEQIAFQEFIQFFFDRQWTVFKKYCNQKGIGLIGDVPIFVSHDSADVWANRELFMLDSRGRPTVVSGFPADPFSPLGQLWGHPHYRWAAHVEQKFDWWIKRFALTLGQFDAVRIDHFLGFYRLWTVPASAKNAVRGKWMRVPGDQLFAALREKLGKPPIIAEDLGSPIPAQLALRDKYGFPGMRILQFAFGDGEYHRPHEFPRHCVAYTGTHDNPTIVGWFETLKKQERTCAIEYVGRSSEQHWNFIRALFTSVAQTVIIPVQDALGLGRQHRMNVPGVPSGNWGWRMNGPVPELIVKKLRALNDAAGRSPIS